MKYNTLLKNYVQFNINIIYIDIFIYHISNILVRYFALDLFYIRFNHRLFFLKSIGDNIKLLRLYSLKV